jgi:hypothetical protein
MHGEPRLKSQPVQAHSTCEQPELAKEMAEQRSTSVSAEDPEGSAEHNGRTHDDGGKEINLSDG